MKLNVFQSFFFAAALISNVFLLLYLATMGEPNKFYHFSYRSSQDFSYLDKKVIKIEDMVIRSERRTFETLSDLERQLKSSVRRFHRQTDNNIENNVENNVKNNVENNVEDFYDDKNDSVVFEQERRRQKIKEVCRIYRNNSNQFNDDSFYEAKSDIFSQSILPQSFLIDDVKTRSSYCYNFKAAASTWMRLFAQLYPDQSFWEEVKDSQHFYKVIYKMSAGSVQRVHEVYDSGDFFTFTVVRHPLDRILSAYRDRIMNGCTAQSRQNVPAVFVELKDRRVWLGTAPLFDRITGCIKVYPTFLEFVRFLILRPDLHDEHWMSFGRHCAPCLVDYDAIVKLETSTRDETFVMTRSGIGRFAALEFKNPTFGGKTEEKRKEFYSTIPCNVLEQLIAIYRMDLDMFDYDVDSFRQICDKGNSSTASIVS